MAWQSCHGSIWNIFQFFIFFIVESAEKSTQCWYVIRYEWMIQETNHAKSFCEHEIECDIESRWWSDASESITIASKSMTRHMMLWGCLFANWKYLRSSSTVVWWGFLCYFFQSLFPSVSLSFDCDACLIRITSCRLNSPSIPLKNFVNIGLTFYSWNSIGSNQQQYRHVRKQAWSHFIFIVEISRCWINLEGFSIY